MKKLSLCLFLALSIVMCSCSRFKRELPVLGIISFGDTAYINLGQLENASKYTTFTTVATNGNEEDAIAKIAEKNPFAIVICGKSNMKNAIDSAKQYNLPLVFISTPQDKAALESYDKAWSFQASENQGGELLGAKIGNAFKNKTIVDQNLDDILQCLEISDFDFAALNSTVQAASDLGVYSSDEKVQARTREQACTAFLELYSDKMPPELVLCENELLALGAQDALKQMNKTSPIAYIHNNVTQIKLDDASLFDVAMYPSKEISDACKAFVENILENEAVNNTTGFRLDKYKTSYFVYTLLKN